MQRRIKTRCSSDQQGPGTISHMACVLLNLSMGTKTTHVPYRGNAPAMQDLIAGRLDFICDSIVTALTQI